MLWLDGTDVDRCIGLALNLHRVVLLGLKVLISLIKILLVFVLSINVCFKGKRKMYYEKEQAIKDMVILSPTIIIIIIIIY